MSDQVELLQRIRSSLLDEQGDLAAVLLRVRVLADGIGSKHRVDWVEYETAGYPEGVDLPSYRIVPTSYTATFPWILNEPIAPAFIEERVGKSWTRREIRESIVQVNAWAELDSLQIDTGNLRLLLQDDDGMSQCMSIVGHISQSSLKHIQHMVRQRLLDFTVALEKSIPSAAAEARATLPAASKQARVEKLEGELKLAQERPTAIADEMRRNGIVRRARATALGWGLAAFGVTSAAVVGCLFLLAKYTDGIATMVAGAGVGIVLVLLAGAGIIRMLLDRTEEGSSLGLAKWSRGCVKWCLAVLTALGVTVVATVLARAIRG